MYVQLNRHVNSMSNTNRKSENNLIAKNVLVQVDSSLDAPKTTAEKINIHALD